MDEFSEYGRSRRFCPGWWILPGCVLALGLVLFAGVALAQAVSQQQTPREQALANRLIGEINNGLQCSTDVVTLQQQIAVLTDELKAEKAKHETPAPAKK